MEFKTAHISEYVFCFQWHWKRNWWIYKKKKKKEKKKITDVLGRGGSRALDFHWRMCVFGPEKASQVGPGKDFPGRQISPPSPDFSPTRTLPWPHSNFSSWILFSSLGEIFHFFFFFAAWVIVRVQDTLEHCIVFIFFKLILTGYQVIFVIGSSLLCSKD